MIRLNKPKFWDKKELSLISILLIPFSLITLSLIFLKKILIRQKNYKIPIICIGNIYIGGTGKTPVAIFVANELFDLGYKPVILRKYYQSHRDEYNMIKKSFEHLILNNSRDAGIKEAKYKGYSTVILDDGFQDYKIKKDLNIVCFNFEQLIGNGFVIPSGPLREPLNSLKDANVVIINGKKSTSFESKILKINKNLDIYYSRYKPININEFKDHKLLAIAGIANPKNFFKLIEENNLEIKEKIIYPDHYEFKKHEIQNIINKAKKDNLKLIMTEKDYYKLHDLNLGDLNYLKIKLEIYNKEKLIKRIKKIND